MLVRLADGIFDASAVLDELAELTPFHLKLGFEFSWMRMSVWAAFSMHVLTNV